MCNCLQELFATGTAVAPAAACISKPNQQNWLNNNIKSEMGSLPYKFPCVQYVLHGN